MSVSDSAESSSMRKISSEIVFASRLKCNPVCPTLELVRFTRFFERIVSCLVSSYFEGCCGLLYFGTRVERCSLFVTRVCKLIAWCCKC